MRNDFKNLLASPFKDVQKATGPLSRLWRTILFDRRVDAAQNEALMQKYLNDPRNNIVTGSDRSSGRNNLSDALAGVDMTIKTLLRGFRLLSPVSVRLTATMTWKNREITEHHVDIDFYDSEGSEDESVSE